MTTADFPVTVAVEGIVDQAVAQRLLRWAGRKTGGVHVKRGKDQLDPRLPGYNNAARFSPWLVLRDLDRDAECPAELARQKLGDPSPLLLFRVPVRAVEAWLLADRERLAEFLAVRPAKVPERPEELDRPKRAIVDIARKSRLKDIRRGMVPQPGHSAEVGPAYSALMIEFASQQWDPERAASRADSLARCLKRLKELP